MNLRSHTWVIRVSIAVLALAAIGLTPSPALAVGSATGYCTGIVDHTADGPAYRLQTCLDQPDPAAVCTNATSVATGCDATIRNNLTAIINSAGTGDVLRIAEYKLERFDDPGSLYHAILNAKSRGVDVQVLEDQDSETEPGSTGTPVRTALLNAGVLTVCDEQSGNSSDDCLISGSGIMHNKFLVMTNAANPSRDLVAQSTYNDTSVGLSQTNEMVVVRNSTTAVNPLTLASQYMDYWNSLRQNTWTGSLATSRTVDWTTTHAATHTFDVTPRADDDILNLLNQLSCGPSHNVVHLAASDSYSNRPAIPTRLAALNDSGCDVQVAVPRGSGSDLHVYACTFWRASGPVGDRIPPGNIHMLKVADHSKFRQIDALFNGTVFAMVGLGSENINSDSLTNNANSGMTATGNGNDVLAFSNHFDWLTNSTNSEPLNTSSDHDCDGV